MAISVSSETVVKMLSYAFPQRGRDDLESKQLEIPSPKIGEVLIKIHAASLNYGHHGAVQKLFSRTESSVTVSGIAGVVSRVGDGVEGFGIGDHVISKLPLTTSGGLAEYVVAPVNMTTLRPPKLSAVEGSGLGTALTALQALDLLGPSGKPRNILITDASGGVGHYAVQLAKLANFHVTAACGGSTNSGEFLKELGADEVVYKIFSSPSGRKYDCVIDCMLKTSCSDLKANLNAPAKVIFTQPRKRDKFSSLLGKLTNSDTQVVCMELTPTLANLNKLVEFAVEEKIKTHIVDQFSFREATKAWTRSMAEDVSGIIVIKSIHGAINLQN